MFVRYKDVSSLLLNISLGNQRIDYYRGRVALFAILKGLGIADGHDVVTQAFTCVAVPEAIMATGARPVYVDIQRVGFNMDAGDLERKLTRRTRAIIIQHTYGLPADLDQIVQIAKAAQLPLIEDCCHTLASTYKGKLVGSFGVGSFYSFEWGKPVVVGIGGSAIVNEPLLRDELNRQYQYFRNPGKASQAKVQLQYLAHRFLYRPWLFWPVRSLYHAMGALGAAESNYNPIVEGQAAEDFSLMMGKSLQQRLNKKLANVQALTERSREIVGAYSNQISSHSVQHPVCPEGCETVFARYPLIARDKPALLAKARESRVELADWYSTPIHPLGSKDLHLVHYEPGSCPEAEARCNQVVTLPVHSGVSRRDTERAICFLNSAGL